MLSSANYFLPDDIKKELSSLYPNCVFSKLVLPSSVSPEKDDSSAPKLTHVCSCKDPQGCSRQRKERQDGSKEEEGVRVAMVAGDDVSPRTDGNQTYLDDRGRTGTKESADRHDKHVSVASHANPEDNKVSCWDQLSMPCLPA